MGNNNLFSLVAEMATELDSLYIDNRFGQKDLLEFMDANEWFGFGFGKEIAPEMLPKIHEPLTLWLSAYKQSGREKIRLMLQYFKDEYPITCRLYQDFISQNNLADEPSAWKLLDYLLSEIDREITEYEEPGFAALAKRLDTGATIRSARLFSEFLRKSRHDGKPLAKWSYTFDSRDKPDRNNDAYSVNSFAVMAYTVFNEEAWRRQDLVGKAVKSPICADLWLYAALHFICALRPGDIARIPAPALPYDGISVLRKISNGTFSAKEAAALTDELSFRMKIKGMKPSKTSAHGNVSSLKLFVPHSLRAPLGYILAISLAHHPEVQAGDGFIVSSGKLGNVRAFFGDAFVTALGGKHFSSRRCNKAYLQGIDAAENNGGGPKGYMLAALARSHKGSIGNLAKTTDIYLKDAKFGGYSPEFIIREMFERGVFSFIPAILLELYMGAEYTALRVPAQTKMICEIGLSAYQIENVADMVERTMIKSRTAVHSILQDSASNIFSVLQNIACGNAPGKQQECLCLLTAAGKSCTHADRSGCIGCGYEIYTKTAMHLLVKEYTRLTRLKNSSDTTGWRFEKILEQAVLPAISEILSATKLLYPNADITGLLDIMEEGVRLVDSGI